jgi:iron complex transport system substrate-binding protein
MSMFTHSRRARAALVASVAALSAVAACSSSSSPAPSSAPGSGTTAPASAAHFPVTVHAANGNVNIAGKPIAIVSLSPTATEMLYAIGAGGQVKAVDKDSDYPAGTPRTTLNAVALNAEAVAKYEPDLVVAAGLAPAQAQQLAKLDVKVLDEPAATDVSQSYEQLTQLGDATGHPDGAAAVIATMKQKIAAIVTTASTRAAKYYYELDQTYYSVTSTTFIGRVLRLLGLTSIADAAKGAAASGGYPQLSAEFILKANPDYVFLADTRCCKQSQATVGKRPGWSALSSVRGGRVISIDDSIASRWGPRIVDLLSTVAAALQQHPVA